MKTQAKRGGIVAKLHFAGSHLAPVATFLHWKVFIKGLSVKIWLSIYHGESNFQWKQFASALSILTTKLLAIYASYQGFPKLSGGLKTLHLRIFAGLFCSSTFPEPFMSTLKLWTIWNPILEWFSINWDYFVEGLDLKVLTFNLASWCFVF